MPILACYETATFNTTTCVWDVTGSQPPTPTVACYETATFNTTTCIWDVTGNQPAMPTLACYETTTFNTTTCAWDVTGIEPIPEFELVGPYCEGVTIPELPTMSLNFISGTWSPALNNTETTTYTFTPSIGECGSTIILTITIINSVLTMNCPPNISVTCNTLGTPPYASLADFITAGGSVSATNTNIVDASFQLTSELSNYQTCPEVIIRTYSIEDDCGNVVSCEQIITVNDEIEPTGTAPAAIAVACPSDVPAVDIASVTNLNDNCSVPVVSHISDVSNNQTCPEIITRTYRITDECGNFTDVAQTITVNDDIAPTGTAPAPITVACPSDVPAVDIASVTNLNDNCSVPVVSHISDVSNNQICPEIITRTYRITDECGNFTDVTQTITVNDDVAPTGTAPAPITVACPSEVPAVNIGAVTNLNDNCSVPVVTHISDVSNNQTCPEIITRTYRITDECGNFTDVTQTITVNDDIAPTGTAPGAITVACPSDVPAVDIASVTNLNDNCSVPVVTHIGDVNNGGTCPMIITRTYRITDGCGNFTDVTQTITVNDEIAPTGTAPANVVVSCPTEVPMPDISLINNVLDNCSVPTVTFVGDVSDNNICNGEVITRTYAITDACGNQTLVSHTITISQTPPSAVLSSTNPTTCGGTEGVITLSGLTPNLGYNVSFNGNTNIYTANGNGAIVIGGLGQGTYNNFVVVLANCAACAQNLSNEIVLVDPPSPVINAGQDIVVCDGESVTLTAQNPDNAQIVWSNNVQNGVSFVPPVGTNIYTITAILNNCISMDDVLVTVNSLPNVSAGPDQNVCEGNQVTLTGFGAVSYQWNNDVVNGVPFTQTVTQQTYTVIGTNANGCQNQDQVTVTMMSNPTPTFMISDTLSCFSPFEVIIQNTTSGSAAVCFWNFGNGTTSNNCDGGIAIYSNEGCYNVSLNVTYTNGCMNSFVNYNAICVSSPPNAAFTANPSIADVGMPIDFINHSEGAVAYNWNFGDQSGTISQPNVIYTYSEGGSYNVTLIAINEFGCTDTSRQVVLINDPLLFYVPNTFTPGDGNYNNIFVPVMTSGFDPWNYELIIFNRWGEIVFVSRHPKKGWDGTYGGMDCPEGTYIWQINVKNADGIYELHRGHVNLLR